MDNSNIFDLSTPGATLQYKNALSILNIRTRWQPFAFYFGTASKQMEFWSMHERLMLACLKTGDNVSARLCLDRLTERFGLLNGRIMALRGLYQEATAKDMVSLGKVLHEYETILADNPVNVPILKRRIAILRSMSRQAEAITAMVEFLNAFPTSSDAWCELADLYLEQGMSAQAIFSLEEALLIAPNSWNLHARLGELLYISVNSPQMQETSLGLLARSVQYFCRSIELCTDYLRGFYGLKLASSLLLEKLSVKKSSAIADRDCDIPKKETVDKLYALATRKLKDLD